MILGIDPGKSGALALYDAATGALEVEDVPTLQIGAKRTVDHYALARVVDNWARHNPVVYLELVGSMPGEGHAGAFDFGRTAGLLCGVCAAHFLRIEWVTPSVWKRALGVKGDKDVSRQRASALLPRHSGLWLRKKDDGRAEAALIAYYGAGRSREHETQQSLTEAVLSASKTAHVTVAGRLQIAEYGGASGQK